MDDELADFLNSLTPFAEEVVSWPSATLRLACYLTDEEPPRKYVSSARVVVTSGNSVLVVRDQNGQHILPGGRLESKETPVDALRREALEETGWSVDCIRLVGIMHYTHTDPVQEGLSYSYPDFLQIVYAGIALEYRPELKEIGGYELGSEFVPFSDVRSLPLNLGQQVFLDAALGG